MAIHQKLKWILTGRQSGKLKGNDAKTKTLIQEIKRQYLSRTEKIRWQANWIKSRRE